MFFKMHDQVPPLNHYEYIRAIALSWLETERYWPCKTNPRKSDTTSSSRSGSSISVISQLRPSGRVSRVAKNITFTDRTLDPYMGALRCQLDTHLSHLTEFSNNKVSNCQLCYWKNKSRVRDHVMNVSGPCRFIQKVPNPPRRATTPLGGYVRRGIVTMVGGIRTRVGV